ncbi:ABC transporter permease [Nocardioides mesophilus]|uniref:ABC transporter permease n=1 Tax=Nocardioides mesophilus TaxID=433659 RepID=A0A7G9R8S5_9ACTN|nr:ABC transporter permease [Nocardioides mesophilus]QNN52000.1 ABC transporter permease [Nocardioides mesophilus]
MKVLLVGLWARRGLNAAALLVIWVAAGAAVLGPMYGRAASEHLVDTRLGERAPYTTGLSYSVPSLQDEPPADDPASFVAPDPTSLVEKASAAVDRDGVDRFWPQETAWLRDRGPTMKHGPLVFEVPLYWREGMCDLAEITGSCPTGHDQALVQERMAAALGVAPGDRIDLTVTDKYLVTTKVDGQETRTEAERKSDRSFEVVGTYRVADPDSPAWFDLSRFTGLENLVAPPGKGDVSEASPATPALLVAPAAFDSQTFRGGVDRPIDPHAVDLDTMGTAQSLATRFQERLIASSTGGEVEQLELRSLFDGVRSEHTLLSRVMIAALAPLVVLALLLLFALVSAGAAVRRPHVALAKLRGHSRAQVFAFAVGEPFLVVALAVLPALALAVLATHAIARLWLVPSIPVVVDPVAWGALAAVVGSALVASAVAALDVIREPLGQALKASLSLRGMSRVGLVLRSAVVAVAVAAVLQLVTSADQSSQLLALLAPLLIALAVAVAGAALLRQVSERWLRRTSGGSSTPAYLASRRLARRRDLAHLMIPLLLAVSVIAFASTATAVSDDWRVSRARAEVGAARTFQTEVSANRLLRVTRQVDPEGRYLAAAVVENGADGIGRRLLIDSTRLVRVAAWDPSWSSESLAGIARSLRPAPGAPITFRGRSLGATVDDVHLRSGTRTKPVLQVQYLNDVGELRRVPLGGLRNGAAPATLTTKVYDCGHRCVLQQVILTGTSSSVLDADGELTLTGISADGAPLELGLDDTAAWRPARPFPVSLVDPPVVLASGPAGLHWEVHLGSLPRGPGGEATMVSGFAAITPATTPDVQPVVVTSSVTPTTAHVAGSGLALSYDRSVVQGVGLNGQKVPMRVVARTQALPGLGAEGSMADLQTSLVEFAPPAGAVVLPQLWVARGTPEAVLDAVRDQGVPLRPIGVMDTTLQQLRTDAFTLGLRLFLVVGLATLLLAVFGVFASAVLQSRWRSYEVASLRVVGVSQRTLLRASVLEYVVMLGLAVVLGVASALLAVLLVLPSLSLGTAGEFEPSPAYSSHPAILAGVGLVLFLVATVIAFVVSRRTTRLGRPSSLRWAEQG